jgi:hypothetical protein
MDVKAVTTEPAAFDPGFPIYPDFTKNTMIFVISIDQVGSTERQGLQNRLPSNGRMGRLVRSAIRLMNEDLDLRE